MASHDISPMELEAFAALLAQWQNHGIDRVRKEMKGFADRHCWHDVLGLPDKIEFARRSLFIYRHFMRTAHITDRRSQLATFDNGYFVYRSRECDCPAHTDLDGFVAPAGHPIWKNALPPNDWECDCDVSGARSERSAARLGGDTEKPIPEFHPAPGFDANRIPPLLEAIAFAASGATTRA